MGLYNQYGIYGIENIVNGKVYVGKTCASFGDRRDCHWACLRNNCGVNKYLQNAWSKYGEDSFRFIILYNCVNGEDVNTVNDLEISYIKKYKDAGMSYNIGSGGDGGGNLGLHLSDEAKRKIGEKNRINMLGRKAAEKTKQKMSDSQKLRYAKMTDEEKSEFASAISKYASGYKWSDESKRKFADRQKQSPNGAKYNVETVKKIRYMHEELGMGYTEISKETGMPRPTVYGIATYKRWKYV